MRDAERDIIADMDDLSGMVDLEAPTGPDLVVGRRYANMQPAHELRLGDGTSRINPAHEITFTVLEDKPGTYVVLYGNGVTGFFSKTSPFHLASYEA